MKTALSMLAILAHIVVSSASADHKVPPRNTSPPSLTRALRVQADYLADEIDYHYSPSEWPHHQMDRIARLAESMERDVAFGHLHRVHRNHRHMERMLHRLDARVRSSVAVHDHGGAGHLCERVWEMEKITKALGQSLKRVKIGQHHDHIVR